MKVTSGEKLSKRGVGGFFRNNIFIILAFLVPATIMFGVFALREYFPFGNRMIMVIDSWHQYYPFLAEYQRMLKEGTSVLYSWNTGGGSSFLGVLANYLGSPLYLLSYFVPSGTPWLQAFLAFTVVLRIGVAGMSFALFLRKVFRSNDLSLVTFGLMYAFCAFAMGYYWNMMWLDTFAIMPLVIAGVVGVLRDRKYGLYIISLALSVIFSFYIGYMVCLFVLLFSVCYTIITCVNFRHSLKNVRKSVRYTTVTCVNFRHILKNAGKMVLFTAIAFMLTAFITVPTYMALNTSDSQGALSSFPTEYTINYAYGYDENSIVNTLLAIACTATNLLAYTEPIKVDQGEPNIACGVLALVLLVFYIASKKVKLKEKIVSGALCAFMLLSFVINQLNYIWHGMSTPAMVYYRWSFIFSFVLLVLAYRAYTLLDTFSKKTFIISGILLMIYLGVALFLQKKLSVAITAAGAVVIILGFILYRMGKLRKRILSTALCLFVVCEMALTAYYGTVVVGYSQNDDYPQNYEEVMSLMEVAEAQSGDELYRTEFLETYTLNDGALYSIFGITTFNSMVNSSYSDFLTELGLAASKINNRYAYLESTPVTDIFLNIKYLIGRDNQTVNDTFYREAIATTDECTLYENSFYVPMGYIASTALLDYELYDTACLNIEIQNQLFSLATGIEEDVFEIIEPSKLLYGEYEGLIEKSDVLDDYYYYIDLSKNPVTVESTEDEIAPMYVEYTIEESGNYYDMLYASEGDFTLIYVNGDEENPIKQTQNYANIGSVGALEAGDTVKVEFELKNNKNNRIATFLVKLNDEVFEQGVEKLRESTMTLEEWSGRGLKGTIDVKDSGLFTTSVLYDKGWKAYVDGKEVEITPIAETFVAFELSEGEHSIELKFTPQGLYTGIAISASGAVLLVLVLIISAARRKKYPTLETLPQTDAEMGDVLSDSEEEQSSAEIDETSGENGEPLE